MTQPAQQPRPDTAQPAQATAPAQPAQTAAPAQPAQEALAPGRAIPRQLSRWRVLVAGVLLVCTVLTTAQLALSWNALRTADADSRQLIRVQEIKSDLLRADALATNAFLVGGLESSAQRAAYDQALTQATAGISAAARAQGADQVALAELAQIVVRYAADMDVARANNRQGLPVGAAYLRTASADLRGRGMVVVDALVAANSTRAQSSLTDQHPVWIALPGLLTLALLIWLNQWIAARFRRRVNLGLLGAAALTLAIGVAATALSATQLATNNSLRDQAFADLVHGASARSAANAAKSNESLRLISRGSGKSFEEAWVGQAATVVLHMSGSQFADPRRSWEGYASAHAAIVAKDDGGDWDGAVALATSREGASASVTFDTLDTALAQAISTNADSVTSTVGRWEWAFLALAAGSLIAGLIAMGFAWRGVTRRLQEYS